MVPILALLHYGYGIAPIDHIASALIDDVEEMHSAVERLLGTRVGKIDHEECKREEEGPANEEYVEPFDERIEMLPTTCVLVELGKETENSGGPVARVIQ